MSSFPIYEVQQNPFFISTDPNKLDVDVIHHYLTTEAYWAQGIAREKVVRSIQHALCFGVYEAENGRFHQIGFARVLTDFTTFAYLADVFILPAYQGQGLGKWLVQSILAHPELQGLRRWTLYTKDAHGLYAQFGFLPEPQPERHMVFRPG